MVEESSQNVFLIQIDASNYAEVEISEFDISRFDYICVVDSYDKRTKQRTQNHRATAAQNRTSATIKFGCLISCCSSSMISLQCYKVHAAVVRRLLLYYMYIHNVVVPYLQIVLVLLY